MAALKRFATLSPCRCEQQYWRGYRQCAARSPVADAGGEKIGISIRLVIEPSVQTDSRWHRHLLELKTIFIASPLSRTFRVFINPTAYSDGAQLRDTTRCGLSVICPCGYYVSQKRQVTS